MPDNSTKFLITDQDIGSRLDVVLVKLLPSLSRSNLKKIITNEIHWIKKFTKKGLSRNFKNYLK